MSTPPPTPTPPKSLDAMFDKSADDLEQAVSSAVSKIENFTSGLADHARPQDPVERLKFDAAVGASKGAYGFGKGMISGTWSLLRYLGRLAEMDSTTWNNSYETVKSTAQYAFRAQGYAAMMEYGSPEDQKWAMEQITKEPHPAVDAMVQHFEARWDEAVKNGKQVELLFEWGTRGYLELATIFLPFTKAKVAVETAEVAKVPAAEDLLSKAKVVCEVEACRTADAVKTAEAARTTKAAETAPHAPTEAPPDKPHGPPPLEKHPLDDFSPDPALQAKPKPAGEKINKRNGLTKSQEEEYQKLFAKAGDDKLKQAQARYYRHLQKSANLNRRPLSPEKWAEKTKTVWENQARGIEQQDRARKGLSKYLGRDLKDNNAANFKEHTSKDIEVTTRPDSLGEVKPMGNHAEKVSLAHEHKHVKKPGAVIDNTKQMRAQREMLKMQREEMSDAQRKAVDAQGGSKHVVTISSDAPLKDGQPQVRPSRNLADRSDVYYTDKSGQVTHQWNVDSGRWAPIEPGENARQ